MSMKPWFIDEAEIIKFPTKKSNVVAMPNVNSYPDFISGVLDLQAKLKDNTISQDSYNKLYADLIDRFRMQRESAETPWFLREEPESGIMQTPQAQQMPPETDLDKQKRMLARLQQKRIGQIKDPDDIAAQIKLDPKYTQALVKRIQSYIMNRKDKDMIEFIEQVTDLIFNLEKNPQKLKPWLMQLKDPKNNFIDPNALLPVKGQPSLKSLNSVVNDSYSLKILNALRNVKPRGRSDAGPYEAAIAILATAITFTRDGQEGIGGDIYFGKRKIEVKTTAGPLYPVKKILPKMEYITKFLGKVKFKAPNRAKGAEGQLLSVDAFVRMLKKKDSQFQKFPFENFIRTVSNSWFGFESDRLVQGLNDPISFKKAWAAEVFDFYKKTAGHEGVLYVSNEGNFAYFVNGDQLSEFVEQGRIEFRNLYWTVAADQDRRDYLKFK